MTQLVSSRKRLSPTIVLACAWLPLAAGCCAISRLGPTDENEVAARELARLGLEALHRGECGEAKARFTHALDKCPHNPQARHHLAELLWQQGDNQRAIQEMDLAVCHSGGDPEWTVSLGRMLLAQDARPAALECADQALRAAPELASAWLLRGDVMRAQDQPHEAQRAYHRSLSTPSVPQPVMTQSMLHLAELYRLEGRPLRALSTLQRLEESLASPDHPPAQLPYEQAIALHALGRYDAAVERFRQARQRLGDDTELLLMLADCQFRTGQYEDARTTSRRLTELAPADPRVSALQANLKTAGDQIAGTL